MEIGRMEEAVDVGATDSGAVGWRGPQRRPVQPRKVLKVEWKETRFPSEEAEKEEAEKEKAREERRKEKRKKKKKDE